MSNNNINFPAKQVIIIVLSLFLLLLGGALFFAQERVLFSDTALILTEILNFDSLRIQEHRYGSFVTQMFPLLGSRMHLQLHTIILFYSAAFNLFYLSVVCILLFRFKNYTLAILMALYYTLFTSDTYFWTNNEIHQAVAWLFLFAGIVIHYKSRKYNFWLHASLFSILTFLSLFTHPLLIIIFPFLWLFILFEENINPYSKKEILMLSCIVLILAALKYYLMHGGGYDTDKVRSATRVSFKDIFGAFTSPMARVITAKMVVSYYFVPLLFITGMYFACKEKKYKQVILVSVFTIGYFLAICLTFSAFSPFYMESEWMPFTIITSILFVYYALPKLKPNMTIALLVVIFTVRLVNIARAAPKFVERKNWILGVLDKMEEQGIHKGYVYRTDKTDSILMISWGSPTESLIASSLKGDIPNRTFITDYPEAIRQSIVRPTAMIGCFGPLDHKIFNLNYFIIDTVSSYRHVELNTP